MARVWIPSLLRDLTGDARSVEVRGETVGEVIEALDQRYPGVRARLCPGGQLAPRLAVAVDGKVTRLGLRQPVNDRCEVRFLPLIEGG